VSAFRRYTNLAATLHLLQEKSITLLNPATWDDKNDAYFMAEYKRYKEAKTVLALCFAESKETYHHWRIFSHGSDGVCIEFDQQKLLSTFSNDPRVKHGYVTYKLLKEATSLKTVELESLPFLKRYPYEDEREYRVIFVDTKGATEHQGYPIKIGWIDRLTLSPWMSKGLSDAVKRTIKSIKGCSDLKISRSTLVDNDTWKTLTSRVRVPN
jgi:hypothetical protein